MCVCACVCVCVCVNECMCVHVCACVCVCVCVCVHVCLCACMFAHARCLHTRACIRVCICVGGCMCVCVHAEERAHAMLSRETECKREQGREGRGKGGREIALEMLEMNRKKHAGMIGMCVLPQHHWRGQALSR